MIRGLLSASARAGVAGPQRAVVLALASAAGRRWPHARVTRTLAYHLREALARKGGSVVTRLPTGSRLALEAADRYHSQILFFGELESETTAFFRGVARADWTVLDVGANSGYFGVLARDLGGSGAVVHCFEPNPKLVALLNETARLGTGIVVVPAGCGARPGRLTLHLGDDPRNTGLGTLSAASPRGGETESVRVISLDDYCDEHGLEPDLVKIDVEGFEDQVLAGMRSLLERRIPRYIVCEMSANPTRPEPSTLIAELESLGYSAHHIEPNGALGPISSVSFENVCFIRQATNAGRSKPDAPGMIASASAPSHCSSRAQ